MLDGGEDREEVTLAFSFAVENVAPRPNLWRILILPAKVHTEKYMMFKCKCMYDMPTALDGSDNGI